MVLQVAQIGFAYPSADFLYQNHFLLNDVSFTLRPGQILHVSGANGAGKTTLLKIIAGILQARSGNINYSADLGSFSSKICYVGHQLGLNFNLTAFENCYFDLKNTFTKAELANLLAKYSLGSMRDKPCKYLSAGQSKRLALLRTQYSNAQLWILDEPFSALDVGFIPTFLTAIREYLACGGMVIYTSHQKMPLQDCDYLEYNL